MYYYTVNSSHQDDSRYMTRCMAMYEWYTPFRAPLLLAYTIDAVNRVVYFQSHLIVIQFAYYNNIIYKSTLLYYLYPVCDVRIIEVLQVAFSRWCGKQLLVSTYSNNLSSDTSGPILLARNVMPALSDEMQPPQ